MLKKKHFKCRLPPLKGGVNIFNAQLILLDLDQRKEIINDYVFSTFLICAIFLPQK